MKRNVVLLPAAEADVGHIFAWIHQRSPEGAATWYRRWLEVIDKLELSADGLAAAPEDADHPARIQQILFKTHRGKTYRALFTICGDTVYVLHVRGPGQDLMSADALQVPEN